MGKRKAAQASGAASKKGNGLASQSRDDEPDPDQPTLTAYEQARLDKVARNQQLLAGMSMPQIRGGRVRAATCRTNAQVRAAAARAAASRRDAVVSQDPECRLSADEAVGAPQGHCPHATALRCVGLHATALRCVGLQLLVFNSLCTPRLTSTAHALV